MSSIDNHNGLDFTKQEWDVLHYHASVVPENAPITSRLMRIRVPGGWLYESTAESEAGALATSMCFVPLPRTDHV